jgi:DsbC/DsbD-like thiol-disulfide interchange protein
MKIIFISAAIFLCSLVVTEVSAQEVTGSIGNGTARRGVKTRGTVVLTIPAELHVNSNKPVSEYAIPTTVRISGTGVTVGAITFPRGTNRKFQFSENLINVYEGTVFFPFTVTVPRSYKGSSITVKAVVRYQACTDEVCYPPKSKTVDITAKVR